MDQNKQLNQKNQQIEADSRSFFIKHRRVFVFSAAFLLPIILLLIVLIAQEFYPFGSKTTIFMDLKDQYMEFLSSLRYSDDSSILFNWSRSMGGNALGLYAYYAGGILSYITCLFPVEFMYAGVLVLQFVKIGLCGLSFGLFVEYGPFERNNGLRTVLFATAYALMSYLLVVLYVADGLCFSAFMYVGH